MRTNFLSTDTELNERAKRRKNKAWFFLILIIWALLAFTLPIRFGNELSFVGILLIWILNGCLISFLIYHIYNGINEDDIKTREQIYNNLRITAKLMEQYEKSNRTLPELNSQIIKHKDRLYQRIVQMTIGYNFQSGFDEEKRKLACLLESLIKQKINKLLDNQLSSTAASQLISDLRNIAKKLSQQDITQSINILEKMGLKEKETIGEKLFSIKNIKLWSKMTSTILFIVIFWLIRIYITTQNVTQDTFFQIITQILTAGLLASAFKKTEKIIRTFLEKVYYYSRNIDFKNPSTSEEI